MHFKQIRMNEKKRAFSLLAFGLSMSLFITSILAYLASPVEAQTMNSGNQPTVATVKNLSSGDLMCYVTLVDDNGIKHEGVGGMFEICENNAFVNKRVNLVYGQVQVNDCQSAEPCGKTRWETLITQMTLADNSKAQAPQIEFIGRAERTTSYRLTVNDSGDILFVYCPANYAPKLGFLRSQYAIQCEPL